MTLEKDSAAPPGLSDLIGPAHSANWIAFKAPPPPLGPARVKGNDEPN